ncbi:hypothetical protein COHA_000616 [Chlorella ohadii]|uniref:Uncharacterized protein n=1 Tax=Chlorella ohadii TaxID=2649997 RepID=A0AAD5H8Y1_9CHLO|nr:hypothetical protein COHA_000616 [Chlorella ohadii]
MLPILAFQQSPSLEAAYLAHAAPTRARVAARFALFRLVLLVFTAARALLAVGGCGREAPLLLGAASNVLPLWAAAVHPRSRYAWLARCGAMATEVLQATIGVINHRHMAPSHAGAQPAAALIYLPYGTTFLWMLCYSAFSTLPFDLLLMQQALVVSGAGAAARGEVVGRWPASTGSIAELSAALGDASAAGAARGADGAQLDAWANLCISYQLPVVLSGFTLSSWMAYRAERRSRLAWLTHMRQSGGRSDSSDSGTAAPQAETAAEAALRQAAEIELVEPLPNDVDFFIQLALPCMVCIGVVAHAIM